MSRKLIYENMLESEKDVETFIKEGNVDVSFVDNCMRLQTSLEKDNAKSENFVFWCDAFFPDNIEISWKFKPLYDDGLAMMFFSATAKTGVDIFDSTLNKRNGEYDQYHSGDINAYHISYFRRKWEEERSFHLCNLRKSYGFHLVAQGADPIPNVEDCVGWYNIKIVKANDNITFYINDLLLFNFIDDGQTYSKVLTDGKIGFRQMSPLIAEYKELRVYEIN